MAYPIDIASNDTKRRSEFQSLIMAVLCTAIDPSQILTVRFLPNRLIANSSAIVHSYTSSFLPLISCHSEHGNSTRKHIFSNDTHRSDCTIPSIPSSEEAMAVGSLPLDSSQPTISARSGDRKPFEAGRSTKYRFDSKTVQVVEDQTISWHSRRRQETSFILLEWLERCLGLSCSSCDYLCISQSMIHWILLFPLVFSLYRYHLVISFLLWS